MSTYQELKGLKIKYLSSDTSGDRKKEGEVFYNSTDFKLKSFVSTATWHSASNVTTARRTVGSAGTQTANFIVGGYVGPSFLDNTEEYNGSGWSNGGSMPASIYAQFAGGTLTAGLAYGGSTDPSGQEGIVTTLEYDGSSWTSSGDLNQKRWNSSAGAGTQTAALASTGYNDGNVTNSEEYNGTSWTAGNAIDEGKRGQGQCGTQTASILFGGLNPGGSRVATVEEYDGTNYSSATSLPGNRSDMGASGTQTAALGFAGYVDPGRSNNTFFYDGTSWTAQPNLSTAIDAGGGSRGGTSSAALSSTGTAPGGLTTATEEFTVSLTATTAASWSSGGNTNNARRNAGCMGTQTAGLYAGGNGPPYLNYSEEYNGTSWTEGNNTTIARECSTSGFGTQTAGAIAGGGAPDNISSPYSGYSNSTDEYNGTSWSEGGDINSHRLGMATCGTQTAGFGAGGYQGANHPDSPPSNTAKCEQYDGSSWTEVADLNTARSSMGHFGTQTASIACRGNSNPTESWDGSSWTNLPASPIVFNGGNHGGGTQTAGVTYGPRSGNYTEAWDGTTWASSIKYSTSRGGNCAGDASSGLLCGGFTGSGNSNATEEFTGETSAAVAVKTIDFD